MPHDGWMPGIPSDPAPTHGDLTPIAVVLHRTIGHWAGDYAVLKPGGLVHFLIGEFDGQVVQFASADVIQYHAGGANDWAVGIEFSGQNGAALTQWQLKTGSEIIHWLADRYSIPLQYDDGSNGRNGPLHKFVAHNYVYEPEDQHVDYINQDDWVVMAQGDDMPPYSEWDKKDKDALAWDIAVAMTTVLNTGTGVGQTDWAGTNRDILSGVQQNHNDLQTVIEATKN